ncbi:hypothetical protein K431DRAFT_24083 [Polychaeton citri CBS 116435]|uniref:Uncharacterized protein n=1 Tax=Polychaeton citri CBS 116435 TaxID=1314669 RepID=A0A9P4QAC6_9PEZI|nr:hypothetical protein K431DRAFT_24083 [Polychaeton citri CBS 116435]
MRLHTHSAGATGTVVGVVCPGCLAAVSVVVVVVTVVVQATERADRHVSSNIVAVISHTIRRHVLAPMRFRLIPSPRLGLPRLVSPLPTLLSSSPINPAVSPWLLSSAGSFTFTDSLPSPLRLVVQRRSLAQPWKDSGADLGCVVCSLCSVILPAQHHLPLLLSHYPT